MIGRPAWYKKFKQQTFGNNSDWFRTNLDQFIEIFRLPSAQEDKVGLLSHLGCGIKTPQSLGERLTLILTGTGTGTGRNWYSFK